MESSSARPLPVQPRDPSPPSAPSARPRALPAPVPYRDQSAADLRFHLLEGAQDAGDFEVFASGRLASDGVVLRADIIGASHRLVFGAESSPSPSVQEVLACAAPSGARGSLVAGVLADLPQELAFGLDAGRLDYRFARWEARGDAARAGMRDVARRVDAAARANPGLGLSVLFPPDPKRGDGAPPRTLVAALPDQDGGIEVRTAHGYPNERTAVLTCTRIARAGAAR